MADETNGQTDRASSEALSPDLKEDTGADHADGRAEPPLVIPIPDLVPGAIHSVSRPPRKPAPGLLEAILWCIVFFVTEAVGLIAVTIVVLTIYAAWAPDSKEYLNKLGKSLTQLSEKPDADQNNEAASSDLGQALAYGMLGGPIAAIGLILVVVPWRVGRDWRRQLGFRRPALIHLVLVCLFVPGFMVLTEGIQEILRQITGLTVTSPDHMLRDSFRAFPPFLTFLAIAFGPGLVEETWCRGFIGRGLCARYGMVLGVLLTSMLFGILHASLAYAIVAASMGVCLHLVFLASRSIWSSILLHTLNNGLAVLLLFTTIPQRLEAIPPWGLWTLFAAALALVVLAGIAFWTTRARIVPLSGTVDEWLESTTWRPEYPHLSAPPAGSGAVLRVGRVNQVIICLIIVSFVVVIVLIAF